MVESDGKLKVLGGYFAERPIKKVEIYNCATDRWTSGKSLSQPKYYFGAAVLNVGPIDDLVE